MFYGGGRCPIVFLSRWILNIELDETNHPVNLYPAYAIYGNLFPGTTSKCMLQPTLQHQLAYLVH